MVKKIKIFQWGSKKLGSHPLAPISPDAYGGKRLYTTLCFVDCKSDRIEPLIKTQVLWSHRLSKGQRAYQNTLSLNTLHVNTVFFLQMKLQFNLVSNNFLRQN